MDSEGAPRNRAGMQTCDPWNDARPWQGGAGPDNGSGGGGAGPSKSKDRSNKNKHAGSPGKNGGGPAKNGGGSKKTYKKRGCACMRAAAGASKAADAGEAKGQREGDGEDGVDTTELTDGLCSNCGLPKMAVGPSEPSEEYERLEAEEVRVRKASTARALVTEERVDRSPDGATLSKGRRREEVGGGDDR